MSIKHLHSFIPYALLITVFEACDTLHPDPIAPKNLVKFSQADYYVLSGGNLIISLKTVVERSWINVTLRISKRPSHADLNFYDGLTLKYKSDKSFIEAKDEFEVSALRNGNVNWNAEDGSLAMITHNTGVTWENQPASPYAGLFNNVSIPTERMAHV